MNKPLAEWQAINDHLENIAAYLRNLLPPQVRVDIHGGRFGEDDLKYIATKAPALLVSVLRIQTRTANQVLRPSALSPTTPQAPLVTAQLNIGISIVTKDLPRLKRHQSAVNLAQMLSIVLPHQTFGTAGASAASSDIECRNLFNSKLDRDNAVQLWGCAFQQTIQFPLPANITTVPEQLFIAGLIEP